MLKRACVQWEGSVAINISAIATGSLSAESRLLTAICLFAAVATRPERTPLEERPEHLVLTC